MVSRLINPELFYRLASEVTHDKMLLFFRDKYPSCYYLEPDEIRSYFSTLYVLNRVTCSILRKEILLFAPLQFSFNIYRDNYSSADVLKWLTIVNLSIETKQIASLRKLTTEENKAGAFLQSLTHDAMLYYTKTSAQQKGMKPFPINLFI